MLKQSTTDYPTDKKTTAQIDKEIAAFRSNRHSTGRSANTISQSDIAVGRGLVGRKQKKEIKAVLHLPNDARTIAKFEEKMCSFYIAQIEKRLQPLQKAQKLEVLQELIEKYRKNMASITS